MKECIAQKKASQAIWDRKAKAMKDEEGDLKSDVAELKSEMSEIKDMLAKLLEAKGGN